jgi:hypothetical protein
VCFVQFGVQFDKNLEHSQLRGAQPSPTPNTVSVNVSPKLMCWKLNPMATMLGNGAPEEVVCAVSWE